MFLGPNLCPNAAKVCAFIHSLEDSRAPKDIAKLKASTAAAVATATTMTEVTTNAVDKMMPALKVASPIGVATFVPSPTPIAATTRNYETLPSTATPSPVPPITATTTEKSVDKVILDIPGEYCCCLSKKLMEDPVLAADGETYERTAIEAYFQHCRDSNQSLVSPITGQDLLHTFLSPNIAIRILIDAWRDSLPDQS